MKIALAIATADRQALLSRTLAHVTLQQRRPDTIFVATPDTDISRHISRDDANTAAGTTPVVHVTAAKGLTRQRNAILDAALGAFDIITFIDDDFLLAPNYLSLVEASFTAHPNWSVIMGHVPYDGARCEGYTFEAGVELLARATAEAAGDTRVVEHIGAYGCNMSVRAAAVGTIRFDERLPLYGWQEDIDFTSQLRRNGAVVCPQALIGVHLGARAGRSSGVRLGFSQVVNPVYLMRKGTMPAAFGVNLMLRNLAANAARSLSPEPHIDRRGRLRGNLLALAHIARGRIEPEHILKLN